MRGTGNMQTAVILPALSVAFALSARGASAQRVTEFPIATSSYSLSPITAGPDGALWASVRYSGRVDRIATDGAVTSPFSLPESSPTAITAGPDGAIWFADGQSIRRVTPAGQSTEFLGIGGAYDLTSGSDGAIWFATGRVGRLTTGGAVTKFDDAPGYLITAGSDGALWTLGTVVSTAYLTRITTAGVITMFALPLQVPNLPSEMVEGSDGAFWFTLAGANKIARVTMSGAYSDFVLPRPGSSPAGITSGPDGALWFTEAYGNRIGRITTSGAITEFAIPTDSSFPWGITTGPDGNLWFVESQSSAVARLEPNRPAAMAFSTVSPCRIADTRDAVGPRGGPALQNSVRRYFHITETCGIPQGAVAVAANVTAVGATREGDLRAVPPTFLDPRTSLMNFAAGQTRAGNAICRLGPHGDLMFMTGMDGPGTVHVLIDVVGYFQ